MRRALTLAFRNLRLRDVHLECHLVQLSMQFDLITRPEQLNSVSRNLFTFYLHTNYVPIFFSTSASKLRLKKDHYKTDISYHVKLWIDYILKITLPIYVGCFIVTWLN